MPRHRFDGPLVARIREGKSLGIRAGIAPHRVIGILVVASG